MSEPPGKEETVKWHELRFLTSLLRKLEVHDYKEDNVHSQNLWKPILINTEESICLLLTFIPENTQVVLINRLVQNNQTDS